MTATSFDPAETRRTALRRCEAVLREAGLDEAEADARILVEDATGVSRFGLLYGDDAALGAEAAETLGAWVRRRLAREPVFRILGRREFWGLDLAVTAAVLDPRPDTETVVLAAIEALGSRRADPLRVVDLGTGSGAILLALLTELPRAMGVGLDRSAEACAVARRNAETCGLTDRASIVEGDFSSPLDGRFDLVVSNPPYIETAAIDDLSPEVRDHDPRLALDGGADGLAAYRAICANLPSLLEPEGCVVFEVGAGQAGDVAGLVRGTGLTGITTRKDLGGHDRTVTASAA